VTAWGSRPWGFGRHDPGDKFHQENNRNNEVEIMEAVAQGAQEPHAEVVELKGKKVEDLELHGLSPHEDHPTQTPNEPDQQWFTHPLVEPELNSWSVHVIAKQQLPNVPPSLTYGAEFARTSSFRGTRRFRERQIHLSFAAGTQPLLDGEIHTSV